MGVTAKPFTTKLFLWTTLGSTLGAPGYLFSRLKIYSNRCWVGQGFVGIKIKLIQ